MRIAVPTEIKNNEFRVAITPVGVSELVRRGHEVYVQSGAGEGSLIPDEDFAAQGATIVKDAAETWAVGEMVMKVKEPIASEYGHLRDDLVLYTYLHLAADRPQTDALLEAGTTAIAYETVQLPSGLLPLLYPMSEIAGCLAPQVGAHALMKAQGGRGTLMGCIGGVPNAKVVVLGGGTAGQNAANIAMGMGANVTILDTDLEKLRATFWRFHNQVAGVASSALSIAEHVTQADLVIGTVLVPGAKAPKLVSNDLVAEMKPGSVLVDVAIDQGGCFEDSHPTTHDDPTFEVHDSLFYCVANMPGAVPHTSTWALTNATLPYAIQLADKGAMQAMRDDRSLAKGLNTWAGHVTHPGVASAFDLPLMSLDEALDHG
ncbi:alanine dehydrogenase [Arachnia propionica]|uniref:Alanine dehydrogenase n=1 Tax=Arachnia propionica TaxID=1750 RepID=A0A3P1T1L9_9ACTN|nr:alanine dehydrogenase [Arachnia propionica]MDO5084416.1 alanine dehydrogenase [Arachnia propionica]RRD03138.1 alanine dehydrogenase [Arachnia propionica]